MVDFLSQNPGYIPFALALAVLDLFWWAILLSAIMSNLVAFNVLDNRNRFVWMTTDFLYRVTEAVLRPLRRAIPRLNGIDLSPIAALLIISLVLEPIVKAIGRRVIAGG